MNGVFSLFLCILSGACAFKTFGLPLHVTKKYPQEMNDQYSPLKFLGGYGPYVGRSGHGISTDTPVGCDVDQVVLVARHGERYPSPKNVHHHLKALKKIHKNHPGKFIGDLEFLNEWNYFMDDSGNLAGLEVRSGPYSGLADHYQHGAAFRNRYGNLWDGESKLPIWASSSLRVVNSARKFGEGFLGFNYTDLADLNILPEDDSQGANALDVKYCDIDGTDSTCGNYTGLFPPLEQAATRLNREYSLDLSATEVSRLMEMAAFDVAIRGDSPWLQVFTSNEWYAYNYKNTIKHWCEHGPGSESGMAIGASFFNATATLLNEGPKDSLKLSLNFAHDNNIVSFLAGAGILVPDVPLSPEELSFSSYDVSEIVPMGARLVIERLNCKAPFLTNSSNIVASNETTPAQNATYPSAGNYSLNVTGYYPQVNSSSSTVEESLFVRMVLNDAVVPLEFNHQGPGFSTPLTVFTEHIKQRAVKYDYSTICRPERAGVPAYPSFWWKYNETSTYNHENGTVGFQQADFF